MNNPAKRRTYTIIVAVVFLMIHTFVMFFAEQRNYVSQFFRVERGMNRMLQSLYERGLLKGIRSITNVSLAYAEGETGIMRTRDLSESHSEEH